MATHRLNWSRYDLVRIIVFILALLSLLSIAGNGLNQLIAATDRPAQVYEDFQQYFWPAGKMIFVDPRPQGGYFYTPTFSVFLHCLLRFDQNEPLLIWQVFQFIWLILLLFLPGFFLARLTKRKSFLYWYLAAVICSFPVYHNLKWGQVSILIVFLSIASVISHRARTWLAPALLALAALVKYYPAFLLLAFILNRDWKFVARFFAIAILLGLLLPGALLGFSNTLEFYRLSHAEMDYAIDWVAGDIKSQFFPHVALRLSGLGNDLKGPLSLVGMLFCLVALARIYFDFKKGKNCLLRNVSLLFLLYPLLINTSWPHYFVWLPFCGLVAVAFSESSRLRFLSIVALLLQSLPVFKLFPGYEQYCFYGLLLFADLLMLLHLLLLPCPDSNGCPGCA